MTFRLTLTSRHVESKLDQGRLKKYGFKFNKGNMTLSEPTIEIDVIDEVWDLITNLRCSIIFVDPIHTSRDEYPHIEIYNDQRE